MGKTYVKPAKPKATVPKVGKAIMKPKLVPKKKAGKKKAMALGTSATSMVMAPPTAASVRVRLDEHGKVHYAAREPLAHATHAGSYFDVPADKFALWKGAGKRTASTKHTDVTTGTNYAWDAGAGAFRLHDKTQPYGHGAFPLVQPNHANLLDRTRVDRTHDVLRPFDVGPYKTNVTFGTQTYPALPTAHGAWKANNDHIVSGASLRERDGDNAYRSGFTIAISNPHMHAPFSPTYGGKQQSWDVGANGAWTRRLDHDVARPASAFHRDANFMLDNTLGMNANDAQHHTPQPTLDLTQPDNRLRQIGAYRTLYRANTRTYAYDHDRGVNPADAAETYHEAHGSFTYANAPGTQGSMTAKAFRQRLVDEGHATAA